MNNDNRRAFLAILLSGIVLFGWQFFFAPKNVIKNAPLTEVSQVVDTASKEVPTEVKSETLSAATETAASLQSYKLVSTFGSVVLDNHLSLSKMDLIVDNGIDLAYVAGVDEKPINITVDSNSKLNFYDLVQVNEKSLSGKASNGTIVDVNFGDDGVLKFNFKNLNDSSKLFIKIPTKEAKTETGYTRHVSYFDDELNLITAGSDDKVDSFFKWFGIDYTYYLFSFVLPKKIPAMLTSTSSSVDLDSKNFVEDGHFELKVVFTKKYYDRLVGLGDNLKDSVDFGMLSIIAVPILRGLQFFYSIFPNYGIAIILLTFLIRLITFPLQWKSTKSMKNMQLIQPEMQKIREKHKDNPQQLQKETMLLFKNSGVNPLGGCFPLLLQMPIFFAFYKVLYNAVELVGAPFYLWILDLSTKDPYYVLPILMTLAMYLQQKITPTTVTDPTQQKVLLFMPFIFGFIMKDLPSGLNLYILVSTLVGIVQQIIIFKKA